MSGHLLSTEMTMVRFLEGMTTPERRELLGRLATEPELVAQLGSAARAVLEHEARKASTAEQNNAGVPQHAARGASQVERHRARVRRANDR